MAKAEYFSFRQVQMSSLPTAPLRACPVLDSRRNSKQLSGSQLYGSLFQVNTQYPLHSQKDFIAIWVEMPCLRLGHDTEPYYMVIHQRNRNVLIAVNSLTLLLNIDDRKRGY